MGRGVGGTRRLLLRAGIGAVVSKLQEIPYLFLRIRQVFDVHFLFQSISPVAGEGPAGTAATASWSCDDIAPRPVAWQEARLKRRPAAPKSGVGGGS